MGLFAGVWCGASKFRHLDMVRYDRVLINNYTLDFDSTVMVREGKQEGAAKGYNPKRPGRNSHHPILAFVSDIRMIANYWLRPGNTSASTNYLAFRFLLQKLTFQCTPNALKKYTGFVRL